MPVIPYPQVAFSLVENAALLALGVLGICQLQDWIQHRLPKWAISLIYGALFGLLGIASLFAAIDAGGGVRLDLRNVAIVIATLLGGIWAGAASAVIVALFRIALGGGGVVAAMVSLTLAFLLAACHVAVWRRRERTLNPRHTAALGCAVALSGLAIVGLFPSPAVVNFVIHSVAPIWLVAMPLTILFLAEIARHFDRRGLLIRALAEREGELQAILDNAPLPIFFKDRNARFRLVNRCYEDWFAKLPGELIGRTTREALGPEIHPAAEDTDRSVVAEGPITFVRDHATHAKPGIEALQITKFPIHARDGKFMGYGGFIADITESRRAERALRENEERFRALIEYSSDIVAIADPDGTITYRNRAETDTLGYAIDETLGRSILEFVHPDDVRAVAGALQEIGGDIGARASGTSRYRHKDGSWRHIAWSARNAVDVPSVNGIIINARDITATRQLEEELLQARKMEAVGQLAGGIAHDFNNILGGILGFAGFLVEDLPAGTPQRGFADRIVGASERARDLVQQILAFSRLSSVERAPHDLAEIVRDTKELLQASLPASTEFAISGESHRLIAEVNQAQVGQILLNLCVNASDALAGRPGRIAIDIAPIARDHGDHALFAHPSDPSTPDQGYLHAGTLDRGAAYARITVADNGGGIAPDRLNRIFEPFYSTKERGRGTGLGLSVVHGTVMAYHGALSVSSRLGQGTVFKIYLPLTDALPQPAVPAPRRRKTGGGARILVVDDEVMITDMVGLGLQRLGYNVVTRNDPEAALRLFAETPGHWHAVISDEVMPGMRGSVLFEQMRRIDPTLHFILCTGYSDHATEEAFRAAGIDAFFHKPVSPEQLAAAMRSIAVAG